MRTEIDFCGIHLGPVADTAETLRKEPLPKSQQDDLIRELMYWQDAGANPLPLVLGEKHPGEGWRERVSPTAEAFSGMVRSGRTQGIGVPLRESDVVIDVEGRARDALSMVLAAAERTGAMPLLERVARGLTEETPSGGLHIPVSLLGSRRSRKQILARRRRRDGKTEVLVEALGYGQQVVVAPSGGRTHSTGRPYRRLCGEPSTIARVTAAELEMLFSLFREIDETQWLPATAVDDVRRSEGPIEQDFNGRKPWKEILDPCGWRLSHQRTLPDGALVTYWTRPGKTRGTSASICGRTMCVFSTEAGLPTFELPSVGGGRGTGSLSKFEVFTLLYHGGDRDAALRDAADAGFGEQQASCNTDVHDAVAFLATCLDSAVGTGQKSKAEVCDIARTVTPPGVLLRIINRERRLTGRRTLPSIGHAHPQAIQWACERVARQAVRHLVTDGKATFVAGAWVLKRKES